MENVPEVIGTANIADFKKWGHRLEQMGFTDSDYDAMVGIGMTDSAIYHVAGDSIVVTVLMAIFGEMLGIDYRKKIGEYVESEVMGR